ncbi:MAG TPA: HAD family hydrolase [Candidatus Bathyarchaeota archaeon]|nr:HAD family hydrolase [Candidatus Bathyarchaeota archaeon]
MSLKAVLFDLGLTLIKTASFPEIYRRILARFGVTASLDDIARAQNATENEFDIATYDESRRKEFWIDYNASLLEKLGIEERRLFLAAQIDELWWECSHVQVYPDVEPTLSRLRAKGLKLGLVSNGFKRDLDYILGELGLEKWFDMVVCIDSCNCAKPDKEIFLYALDKLGVKPSEALFVGDSVVHDYEGALNVGVKPMLIDREGKLPSRYDKIASLTELLTLV